MKKKGFWIVVLFGLAFAAVMYFSTRGLSQHRVEVCMEFRGRTACRTASGATREAAERTARDNACALLAAGVTETIACGNTAPSRVTWLESN